MKISQVNKMQFGSPITGIGLLIPKEVLVFTIPPGNYADGHTFTKYVDVPNGQKYVSDAQYSITGSMTEPTRPWTFAPRKYYFIPEGALPIPRVYLYKTNEANRVRIDAKLYFSQPITGTYYVNVDVWVYVSHFL